MSNASSQSARGAWSPWPIAIISFFAIAILGCLSFVIFCNLHPSELVSQDYYEQELRYQSQIDRIERARVIPEQVSITFDSLEHRLVLAFPKDQAAAETNGAIELYRPSKAGMDRRIDLKLDQRGRQVINTTQLAPGLWRVKVFWSVGGRDFFVERKVEIPS